MRLHRIPPAPVVLLWLVATNAIADIATDGSVGQALQLEGPHFVIPNSLGSQRGSNLFHSFTQFTVGSHESVTFTSDHLGDTRNIISRISGASPSTIDGRLASSIPGADLWLINPNGILFGPGASLDLRGGLHLSSARYIALQDGGSFGTDLGDPDSTLLSSAPVAAFGFLPESAPLQLDASLGTPEGSSISVTGGDITVTGNLAAPSGTVSLVALGSAGEVGFTPDGLVDTGSLAAFERLADIDIGNGDGPTPAIRTSGERPGSVVIRGDRFLLDGFIGAVAGDLPGDNPRIDIEARTEVAIGTRGDAGAALARSDGTAPAPDILIRSPTVRVGENGALASLVAPDASGASGDIRLAVDRLSMAGAVSTSTLGAGDSGDITIQGYSQPSADSVQIDGFFAEISADSGTILTDGDGNPIFDENGGTIPIGADGNAGNIQIDAEHLTLNSGTVGITTDTVSTPGGQITLNVDEFQLLSGIVSSTTEGGGQAGSVRIRGTGSTEQAVTPSLSVEIIGGNDVNSSILAASSAAGNAGNITITARQARLVDGGFIETSTNGTGGGGSIEFNVDSLELTSPERGANAFQSAINSLTFGSGDAGRITVQGSASANGTPSPSTRILFSAGISGGMGTSSISSQADAGAAGSIEIHAREFILEGRTPLASDTVEGAPGAIVLNVDSLTVVDAAIVSTITLGNASGGEVRVRGLSSSDGDERPASSILVSDSGSISSASFLASGDGGTITLRAEDIGIARGGSVDATSFSESGRGGNVNVFADTLLLDGGEILATTIGRGDAGSISISGLAGPATSTVVRGGSIISASGGAGSAGGVRVDSSDLQLQSDAVLSVQSINSGAAGAVVINADSVSMDDSTILATVANNAGGSVELAITGAVFLANSLIEASAQGLGPGDSGGNVLVRQPGTLTLNNSQLRADANAGAGGNISLGAGTLVFSAYSTLSASSQTNVDGQVQVEAVNQITGGVLSIETPQLAKPAPLRQRCTPSELDEQSSLVVRRAGPEAVQSPYLSGTQRAQVPGC